MIFVQDLAWTAIACFRTLVNEDFFVKQMRQVSLAILRAVLNMHPPFRAGIAREISELQRSMFFTTSQASVQSTPKNVAHTNTLGVSLPSIHYVHS